MIELLAFNFQQRIIKNIYELYILISMKAILFSIFQIAYLRATGPYFLKIQLIDLLFH